MTTPTMSPDRFRQRLDLELTELPDGPSPTDDVAAGRRLLRRRRGAAALATAVALCAGGSAWAAVGHQSVPAHFLSDPRASAMSDATLTRACREQWNSDTWRDSVVRFWEPGRPRLMARDTLGAVTVAAFESADGAYWAECRIVEGAAPEFNASWQVYDNAVRDTGFQYGEGPDCLTADGDLEPDCDRFLLEVADHLPAEVVTVRFVLASGSVVERDTVDGHYALVAAFDLPPGHDRMTYHPIARVTYLDADGTPLAAQAMNGSGEGSDGERVGGLPPLAAYAGYGAEALE